MLFKERRRTMTAVSKQSRGTFMEKIQESVIPPLLKLGGQRHISAIRDGFMGVITFLIVGSFFLIVAYPPVGSLAKAVEPYVNLLLVPFSLTMGIMGLYLAFAIAYALARHYPKVDPLMAAVSSLAVFLIAASPQLGDIKTAWLGTQGLFVAIIVGIVTVEVFRFFIERRLVIRMPAGTPPAVTNAFLALVPQTVLIIAAWLISAVAKINAPQLISTATAGLFAASDSFWVWIGAMFVRAAQWCVGIHELTLLGATYMPFTIANTTANAQALAAGQAMPHISTWPLWVTFAFAANTVPFTVLALFLAKSARLKALSRLAIVPGIFCISEPILFGVPFVFNPIMWPPFILSGLVSTAIGWLATRFGLMSRMFINPPWTTPAMLQAWLATGGDWRAVVIQFFAYFVLGVLIYYPFFRAWDKHLVEEESKATTES
jgi:PTS system cellobiose-specific IIC component